MGVSGLWFFIGLIAFLYLASSAQKVARWRSQKLVLRSYYVAFDPVPAETADNGQPLSHPVVELLRSAPVYAAIVGRPAGLINFLREAFGLPVRFEFGLSGGQAVMQIASFGFSSIKCAQLAGLNSVSVEHRKPGILKLLIIWLLINALFRFIDAALTYNAFMYSPYMYNPYTYYPVNSGSLLSLILSTIIVIFYYRITNIVSISFNEGGQASIDFQIYPALLERLTGRSRLDLLLPDANRIVQIFRALKDARDNAPVSGM